MRITSPKLRSFVARIETIDEQIAALNADKAEVYQLAKKAKADVPAMRLVIAERRRREKDPSKYEALQGTAEEYRSMLEAGMDHAHTRVHAHELPPHDPATGEITPPPADGATDALATPPPATPSTPSDRVSAGAPDGVPGSADLATTNDAARCEGQDSAGTDDDWERRDGAATYDGVRQIQREGLVASAAARLHPAEIDMPEIPGWLRRA